MALCADDPGSNPFGAKLSSSFLSFQYYWCYLESNEQHPKIKIEYHTQWIYPVGMELLEQAPSVLLTQTNGKVFNIYFCK